MNSELGICVPSPPKTFSTPTPNRIDFNTVKQRQHVTWTSGNYAIIGTTLQIVGELLAEAADVPADERVLDVAAGNGNATLAAARRYAQVTSTDYVAHLLDKGALRAPAEGLKVKFQEADAEALPFDDGSFDVALSTFGVMFTPQQTKAAGELVRAVRSGGRIGMTNWTPEGFIGQLFGVIATHLSPPAGIPSPLLWGAEPRIVELFGEEATDIRCRRREFYFRYRSAAHWIEVFRNYYGPVYKAYAALEPDQQASLTKDITLLLEHSNVGGANSLVIPSEYLEIIITRK